MAVCDYCGLEADVTITSDNKYTYNYPELECRFFQEQAAKTSDFQMLAKTECPHLVKAVEEEVTELRAEDCWARHKSGPMATLDSRSTDHRPDLNMRPLATPRRRHVPFV